MPGGFGDELCGSEEMMRWLIIIAVLAIGFPSQAQTYNSVYWSDGDSGRLGSLKFRLANIDAPETGGQDIGQAGIAAGHLKPWPHINGKAQSRKPDWCKTAP